MPEQGGHVAGGVRIGALEAIPGNQDRQDVLGGLELQLCRGSGGSVGTGGKRSWGRPCRGSGGVTVEDAGGCNRRVYSYREKGQQDIRKDVHSACKRITVPFGTPWSWQCQGQSCGGSCRRTPVASPTLYQASLSSRSSSCPPRYACGSLRGGRGPSSDARAAVGDGDGERPRGLPRPPLASARPRGVSGLGLGEREEVAAVSGGSRRRRCSAKVRASLHTARTTQ